MEMTRDMGFDPYENGGLGSALAMEESVLVVFPEWKLPGAMAVLVVLFWVIFALSRFYFATPGIMRWDQLPLKIFNKVFGASTLTLLSLTYLPSTCAAFLQVVNGTKHKRFPGWLDAWLKARKQLGLIAFGLICVHACISTLILSPTYMSAWFEKSSVLIIVPANHTHDVPLNLGGVWMTRIGELSLLFGILAVALMTVLAVTSLPSVTSAMSWAEWRLVHSQLGYFMLTLAVTHVYVMGVPKWVKTGFPLVFFRVKFMSIVFPTLVIVLRLVLLLPCLSAYVDRIRLGWERKRVDTRMGVCEQSV
nr:hypothetical protein BaRGS_032735 [Batillaria attramentaria]